MVIIIKNLQLERILHAEKLDEDNQHKKHHTNNVNKTWAYKQLEVYTKSNIIFRRKLLRTSRYNPNSRPIIRDKSTRMVIIIKNLQLERILHNLISINILFANIFRFY
jgi:hypothetical protein